MLKYVLAFSILGAGALGFADKKDPVVGPSKILCTQGLYERIDESSKFPSINKGELIASQTVAIPWVDGSAIIVPTEIQGHARVFELLVGPSRYEMKIIADDTYASTGGDVKTLVKNLNGNGGQNLHFTSVFDSSPGNKGPIIGHECVVVPKKAESP